MVNIIKGYETEEQQVDAIKQWWNENGNVIIICTVVGLAGLWGWNYYGDTVAVDQEKTSNAYTEVLTLFTANAAQEAENLQLFISGNEGNNYATLASLLLAKEAVKAKNFELAKNQLSVLLAVNNDRLLTPIIALRLARIEAQLGEYKQALATADKVTEKGFVTIANQIKGSIYLQQGNIQLARNAFQTALAANEGGTDPFLQLQLNDLTPAEATITLAPKLNTEGK